MSPAKEELIRLIEDQPDDSSREEILPELAFAAMVERGIADSDAGRTISNEEMARRIESWLSTVPLGRVRGRYNGPGLA